MRLLLDTHALLWTVAEPETLSPAAREAIGEGENAVHFSAASVWEIAIKSAADRLQVPPDFLEQMLARRYSALDITSEHALAAGRLPRHHGDLFDRMLVAQAQLEGLTLVTRDPHFAAYGIPLLAA